jgi:cytochrome P450
MEAQLVLAAWLHKLRFERCSAASPGFEPLFTLRPLGGIPMTVTRREPSGPVLREAAAG